MSKVKIINGERVRMVKRLKDKDYKKWSDMSLEERRIESWNRAGQPRLLWGSKCLLDTQGRLQGYNNGTYIKSGHGLIGSKNGRN